jgi:hypothetical protein
MKEREVNMFYITYYSNKDKKHRTAIRNILLIEFVGPKAVRSYEQKKLQTNMVALCMAMVVVAYGITFVIINA